MGAQSEFSNLQPHQQPMTLMCFLEFEVRSEPYPNIWRTSNSAH
jgi:hypothetical protein